MIQPNEIRLGNILNYLTDEDGLLTTTIDWQDIKYCTENPQDFNRHYSPIPLTEEVLLKCGFKPSKEPNKYLSPHKDAHCDKNFESMLYDTNTQEFVVDASEYSGVQIECKFLHHLQNLFFALTGQELKYRANK